MLAAKRAYPDYNRYQLAALLGVSEQTVQRRLEHNNVRGGKYATQTRVRLVGGLVEQWGAQAGLYLYDRRVWAKDPAWENSRWHSSSYRSVDEFEYLYVFWKPGITTVDRQRLSPDEWQAWGSRGVWHIPSVRANDDHPAKFPIELARRVVRLFSAPGEVVLDCFVGSGTTPVAAIRESRQYLGIDLLPEYVALAEHNCTTVSAISAAEQHRSHNYHEPAIATLLTSRMESTGSLQPQPHPRAPLDLLPSTRKQSIRALPAASATATRRNGGAGSYLSRHPRVQLEKATPAGTRVIHRSRAPVGNSLPPRLPLGIAATVLGSSDCGQPLAPAGGDAVEVDRRPTEAKPPVRARRSCCQQTRPTSVAANAVQPCCSHRR